MFCHLICNKLTTVKHARFYNDGKKAANAMAKNGTAIHFCDGHFFKLSEDFRCAGHKAKVKGRESF